MCIGVSRGSIWKYYNSQNFGFSHKAAVKQGDCDRVLIMFPYLQTVNHIVSHAEG